MDTQPSRLTHVMNHQDVGDERVKRKWGRGQDRPCLCVTVGGVNSAFRSVINHTRTSRHSHLNILEDKILYKGKFLTIIKIFLKKKHIKYFV